MTTFTAGPSGAHKQKLCDIGYQTIFIQSIYAISDSLGNQLTSGVTHELSSVVHDLWVWAPLNVLSLRALDSSATYFTFLEFGQI